MVTEELKDFLVSLGQNDERHSWIREVKAVLLENRVAGEQIRKSRIPQKYLAKYGVNNLYRYRHPRGFRSLYTLLNEGTGLIAVILDLMSHKEYERTFGY